MADIVICEFMDQAVVDSLSVDFDVVYDPALADNPDALSTQIQQARALIVRNRTRVDARLLEAASSLEVVGRLGVGLDNIDLDACRERDIQICPARGANETAVAEYVIAAVLILLRGAYFHTSRVLAGEWPRTELIGSEAHGKSLGLIGCGAIARAVAVRACALGMRTAACDPYIAADDAVWSEIERLDLDELLRQSDVVSIHVPLSDETRKLLGPCELGLLKPGAILINTSRGGIVDEQALATALKAGELGGAAVDVFEREPLDAQSASVFVGAPNLLLTPHIAGLTNEANTRVGQITAANVRQILTSTT